MSGAWDLPMGMVSPMVFVRGPERPDKEKGVVTVEAEKGHDPLVLDPNNKGYTMMKALGWEDDTPLGRRGRGIMRPLTDTIKFRKDGNKTGLGYDGCGVVKEKRVEGDKVELVVRITDVKQNYAVGITTKGTVFIPNGAVGYISRRGQGKWGFGNRQGLIGFLFVSELTFRGGKYDWRVAKVKSLANTRRLYGYD